MKINCISMYFFFFFLVRYMIIKPVCIIWHPYYCIHLSKYLPVASKSATLLFKYNLLRKCFLNTYSFETPQYVQHKCLCQLLQRLNMIQNVIILHSSERFGLRSFLKKFYVFLKFSGFLISLEKLCLICFISVYNLKVGKSF